MGQEIENIDLSASLNNPVCELCDSSVVKMPFCF